MHSPLAIPPSVCLSVSLSTLKRAEEEADGV